MEGAVLEAEMNDAALVGTMLGGAAAAAASAGVEAVAIACEGVSDEREAVNIIGADTDAATSVGVLALTIA